jgi:hypothetical protein
MGIILFCALMTTVAVQLLVRWSGRWERRVLILILSRLNLAEHWAPVQNIVSRLNLYPLFVWELPVSGLGLVRIPRVPLTLCSIL